MKEYSFLEYSFFVEIRSKTICNMNINVILHVIATSKVNLLTRHLDWSESSPNFVCLQTKVGLTGSLHHLIQ